MLITLLVDVGVLVRIFVSLGTVGDRNMQSSLKSSTHVLSMRNRLQALWVEACPAAAEMIQLKTFRHRSDKLLVSDDVNASFFTYAIGCDDDHAVSLRHMKLAGPYPASIFDLASTFKALSYRQSCFARHGRRISTGEVFLK